jgi:hypothetical protein
MDVMQVFSEEEINHRGYIKRRVEIELLTKYKLFLKTKRVLAGFF